MARKRHTAEQIIAKLREAEVALRCRLSALGGVDGVRGRHQGL